MEAITCPRKSVSEVKTSMEHQGNSQDFLCMNPSFFPFHKLLAQQLMWGYKLRHFFQSIWTAFAPPCGDSADKHTHTALRP